MSKGKLKKNPNADLLTKAAIADPPRIIIVVENNSIWIFIFNDAGRYQRTRHGILGDSVGQIG